jgi:serine/threonine protein kinase
MPIEYSADYVEKRLSPRNRAEPEAIAHLRSEAALLSHLSTLRVTPRLLASGEDASGPWHRVERVRIPTLDERLASAPLDPFWIERAVQATFAAIALLHEAADSHGPLAVVHADLSPSNIAIDDAGTAAIVLDFDLASWRDAPARDGAFRGTIAYAAPEIARGEHPTVRSDLFSLAASLFHAATGRAPRSGPSLAALLATAAEQSVLTAEHETLGARGAGHRAILACLAHDPMDRPTSARDVLASLR